MRTLLVMMISLCPALSCNDAQRGNGSDRNTDDSREAAADSNTDKFNREKRRDAEFVYAVVESHYNEIKLAELGNQKSRIPAMKRTAEMLQGDHTASLNELKILAQAKAISVPVEEPETSRRRIEDLAEESGEEFEEEWRKEMIDLHDKNIKRFEKRLEDTQDAELRAFINRTLPVLRRHHDRLKELDHPK